MTQIMSNHWTPVFVAFLLGLVIGWMVWGAPWRNEPDDDDAYDEGSGADNGEATRREPLPERPADIAKADMRMGSIEAEISRVKTLIETTNEDDADLGAELDAIDNAVKRANGRLKLILKSVGNAKDAE